jgi:hypothetical protein
MASKKIHQWTIKEIALLGTMSDRRCAELLGLSQYSIFSERNRRAIPANAPRPTRLKWSKKQIALLGKVPDGEVATMVGTWPSVVFNKRVQLGIPAYVRKECWRKFTKKEISLLGTKPDSFFAKKFGTTVAIIGSRRISLGIPSYRARNSPTRPWKLDHDWTPKEIALLGTQTDQKIAKILDIGAAAVRAKRIRLGIPANRGRGQGRGQGRREAIIAELKVKYRRYLPPGT